MFCFWCCRNFFKPTRKLTHGVMVHTIDGHTCSGEPGYNQAFTYIGLAEATGGTNFQLCQNDWSSYFSTIAGAVADSTVGTKCEHDIPRSETNSALLVGNLEPDTPFSLTFEYTNQAPASGKTLLTYVERIRVTPVEPPLMFFLPFFSSFKGLYNHQPTHVPNPDAHMPPIHVCAPCDAQLVIHAMPTMHLNVKDKLNPRALWHIVIQIPSTIHYLIVHSRRKRDCSRSMTHRTQERPFFVTKHVIWFDHSHKEVL